MKRSVIRIPNGNSSRERERESLKEQNCHVHPSLKTTLSFLNLCMKKASSMLNVLYERVFELNMKQQQR